MTHTPFQGVVTPEAVVLEFETAGIGSRGAAVGIDLIIRFFVAYVVITATAILDIVSGEVLPSWVGVTFLTIVSFLLIFGYPIILESLWNGRTIGKAIFGLRVITVEGAPISFRHAAIRGTIGLFEILITTGAVALIASFLSPKSQRLGDYVAGTLVLRERNAMPTPRALTFTPPPAAIPFAESLDVGSLSAQDYGTVRSFLVRSHELSGQARSALAQQLANEYVAKLRVTPPVDMPAEVFLVSVASAYQRRFQTPRLA